MRTGLQRKVPQTTPSEITTTFTVGWGSTASTLRVKEETLLTTRGSFISPELLPALSTGSLFTAGILAENVLRNTFSILLATTSTPTVFVTTFSATETS